MPPNEAVPSPADGDSTIVWWDDLANQADGLRQAGFTAIWLPPALKTSDRDQEKTGAKPRVPHRIVASCLDTSPLISRASRHSTPGYGL